MRPLLAAIELPQVQEIRIADVRSVAEHKPPGKDGSLLQDLGRVPTLLTLWGVATGPDAPQFLEDIKTEMRPGIPVTFVADITSDTELEEVIIDDVEIRQLAGKPDRFAYAITLREHIEPVEPEDTSAINSDILGEAGDLLDGLVDGLDLAALFSTGLEGFVEPLSGLFERLSTFRRDLESAQT